MYRLELLLVTSAPVKSAVTSKLGSAPAVSAAEVAQTNVIAITAIAADPALAARTANTYARAFVTYQQTVALQRPDRGGGAAAHPDPVAEEADQ